MEKLYAGLIYEHSGAVSEGWIPFEIVKKYKTEDKRERIIAKNNKYGEIIFELQDNAQDNIYMAYKNEIYFYGILDIVDYYDKSNQWITRSIDDMFIYGMSDHIEESYELKISYDSPFNKFVQNEYFDILNPSNVDEGINYVYNKLKKENKENEVVYAALLRRIRKWTDGKVSFWEKAEMIEYWREDIEKIINK